MAKTEIKSYVFSVKESGKGIPWIMLEPMDGDFDSLDGGHLGLHFAAGTPFEEVEDVALLLNRKISNLSLTTF